MRSLARTNNVSAAVTDFLQNHETYDDDDDDDAGDDTVNGMQVQAADTHHDGPVAVLSMGANEGAFNDLERGEPDRDR